MESDRTDDVARYVFNASRGGPKVMKMFFIRPVFPTSE
jgi:hypothetical protein